MFYVIAIVLAVTHGGAAYLGYKKGTGVAADVAKIQAVKQAALDVINKK